MMRIFDPVVKRKSYIDFTLGFLQGLEFDPLKSMGNIAAVMISDVVGASLVGMSLDVVYVTPRALGWLDYAIENQETLGLSLNYHQFKLHRAKALGLWMQAGINSEETWLDAARAIFVCGRHDANVYPKNKLRSDYLDDYMSLCFQSGQYEQGVLEFEERSGSKNLNFLSLKRALKPREIGYLLCLNKLENKFEAQDLLLAGRRMLKDNLEGEWFRMGQYTYAAMWLKVVHWHDDPTLTPLLTILKAYDDMPNVICPDFAR